MYQFCFKKKELILHRNFKDSLDGCAHKFIDFLIKNGTERSEAVKFLFFILKFSTKLTQKTLVNY